ncbi:hypothetical protein KUTeg_008305 [Tegillarca granosa]|uniref:FAS1 domain-containing protein n=1 Tax=Tegillarca granosa TaxID=220873 RepID=A0ABQ9F8R3_TEGGR|nr:hypothetical protein KUTeg_008305 [Tegillarca granosa]
MTVFVPTNEAFRHLPDQLNGSLQDRDYVRTLLQYHTVNGTHLKTSFINNKKLRSLMKEDEEYLDIIINIYQGGQVLTVSGSPITNPDNKASNGVVHIIDRVMYMQPILGDGKVATLKRPIHCICPFGYVLMKNHVVPGTYYTAGMYNNEAFTTLLGQTIAVEQTSLRGNTTISGAWLILPDFTCTNGVVHITSEVFLPPDFFE